MSRMQSVFVVAVFAAVAAYGAFHFSTLFFPADYVVAIILTYLIAKSFD